MRLRLTFALLVLAVGSQLACTKKTSEQVKLAEPPLLTEVQALLLADTKPEWELYDLERDPLEFDNRVDDPELADELHRLRALLDGWVERTDANNSFPEELDTIIPQKARKRVIEQRAAETEDASSGR